MNPRVSRSSALASKATGFPIAKIAAKLAVGYSSMRFRTTLRVLRLPRSSLRWTTWLPRYPVSRSRSSWRCAQAHDQDALGGRGHGDRRTFTESLMKAAASLEVDAQDVHAGLDQPSPYRVFAIFDALRAGMDIPQIFERTSIDPFFIASIARIVAAEGSPCAVRRGGPARAQEVRTDRRPSLRLRGLRSRLYGA